MKVKIEQISPDIAEALCRKITADLPEYFGLPEVNEHYALGVRTRTNVAIRLENVHIGLLSLEFPYASNANIYWMGIMRKYHRQGLGVLLVKESCDLARRLEAKTMTVETLAPNEADENYLKTYRFYETQKFMPLINLKPKGYHYTMVYMVRFLDAS